MTAHSHLGDLATPPPMPLKWTALGYAAGWATYGAEYGPAEYAQSAADNIVHLRGLVKRLSAWSTNEAITVALPVGMRPAHKEIFIAFGNDTLGGSVAWRVDVAEDGTLHLLERIVGASATHGEVAYLSLSGISFSPA